MTKQAFPHCIVIRSNMTFLYSRTQIGSKTIQVRYYEGMTETILLHIGFIEIKGRR